VEEEDDDDDVETATSMRKRRPVATRAAATTKEKDEDKQEAEEEEEEEEREPTGHVRAPMFTASQLQAVGEGQSTRAVPLGTPFVALGGTSDKSTLQDAIGRTWELAVTYTPERLYSFVYPSLNASWITSRTLSPSAERDREEAEAYAASCACAVGPRPVHKWRLLWAAVQEAGRRRHEADEDYDDRWESEFSVLSNAMQWDVCLYALKRSEGEYRAVELQPDNWRTYGFGDGATWSSASASSSSSATSSV
jgi:alpha-beta hydrolase superfamily lysophospholipase